MPVQVPSQYNGWVVTASQRTGIPYNIVAAQIYTESSFNPNAVSSANAQGIAQFLPSTFAQYSSGSPFNPSDALVAYIGYMSALLKQYGGDIRNALAAYNCGTANCQAGQQYADGILNLAGSPNPVTVSTGTGAQTTGFPNPLSGGPLPGGWLNPFNWPALGASQGLKTILGGLGLSDLRDLAVRGGLIILGALMVLVGIVVLAGRGAATTALTVAAPESRAAGVATGAGQREARRRTEAATRKRAKVRTEKTETRTETSE